MYEEIYIDLVFMANLLLDYFLLRFVGVLFKCRTGRGRCVAAAFAGAVCSSLLLVKTAGEKTWMTYLLHGACAMMMIRVGCGLKKYSMLLKGMLALYLAAFLWGGFWEVFLKEKSITFRMFVMLAAGTYLGLTAMLYLSDSLKTRWKSTYPVTLLYRGKVHTAYGYYDTGDLLTDPYSKMPVSIVTAAFAEKILSKESVESLRHYFENPGELESTKLTGLHPRIIPCQTLGKENGVLLVITLEELCIHTPKEVVHVSKPVFGISWEPSDLGKECEVLIHSNLLSQEGTFL